MRENVHDVGLSVPLPQDSVSPSHCGLSPSGSGLSFPDRQGFREGFSPSSTASMSDDGSVPPPPTLSSHTANNFPCLRLHDHELDTEVQSDPTPLGRLAPSHRQHINTGLNRQAHSMLISSPATLVPGADIFDGEKKLQEDQNRPKSRTKNKKEDAAAHIAHQRELAQDGSINSFPFHFKPLQLAHMLGPEGLATLTALGGTEGIIRGLGTHPERGLRTTSPHPGEETQGAGQGAPDSEKQMESPDSVGGLPDIISPNGFSDEDDKTPYTGTIDDRKRVYGENVLPSKMKTLRQLLAAAVKDKILILLSISALVSLGLGLYQDFGTPRKSEPPVHWVEGLAIIIAIAIVVVTGSMNHWAKERHFRALNERKEERGVKVIRDGVEKVIDIKEVVVGDIALVEPGEVIPCDGILISGHKVQCDEFEATGESDILIPKRSYTHVVDLKRNGASGRPQTDCFMISGSKVIGGVGKYVVIAVGKKSSYGRNMTALRTDTENPPTSLQLKVNIFAQSIVTVGSRTGLVLFVALVIKFLVELCTKRSSRTPIEWGIKFVNILIISLTSVVIAVPEGLTLAVTLALAFVTKRMTYQNLLVRVLGSCETMANATVICTDKTGTLTQNSMVVVAGSVGIHAKFDRSPDENSSQTKVETETSTSGSEPDRRHCYDFSIDQAQLNKVLSPELQGLFNEAIAINSMAFEDVEPITGRKMFVGSETEAALLQFAKDCKWRDAKETRDAARVVQIIPFVSDRKVTGVVIMKPHGGYRAYFKGASEILARNSTKHIVVREDGNYSRGIEVEDIDELSQENISRTIIFYANQKLRTIALAFRDFDSWPPEGTHLDETDEVPLSDLEKDLTLIAITAIDDPLRVDIRDAVLNCQRAGVSVRMCTGDNVLTARSIAMQCGIFRPGGIIMEGSVFRDLSPEDKFEFLPRIQVLARSTPYDKKIFVEALQQSGEVVGVTGDGTNDGPTLKAANVGFSMGITSTEVAKQSSDIILLDNNFALIPKSIMGGRSVNEAVRKFLQFQISTMITAVAITFVSSLADSPALSTVQLLWIGIIMDAFAALALVTDPPSENLLDQKPHKKTAPLFTVEMYKMILLQSVYQITSILIFHFLGWQILGFRNKTENNATMKTLVFNAFVFAQIFNSVNCRRVDSRLNIFEGILRNRYFIAITLIEIATQVIFVFVGGAALQVTRIDGREWGISLALGFVSIPWGLIIRLLPNKPFERLFKTVRLIHEDVVLPVVRPDSADRGIPMLTIRGGAFRSSALSNTRQLLQPQEDQPRIPSILNVAPIIGAVIGNPQYSQAGSRSDPANADPSVSSTTLWDGKLSIHPGTDKDDPVYKRVAGAVP